MHIALNDGRFARENIANDDDLDGSASVCKILRERYKAEMLHHCACIMISQCQASRGVTQRPPASRQETAFKTTLTEPGP